MYVLHHAPDNASLAERLALDELGLHPRAPGALGCYVAPLVRWLALYPRPNPMKPDLAAYPALRAVLSDPESRPAAIRVAAAEGLGPKPFTAPACPAPPEGSPT